MHKKLLNRFIISLRHVKNVKQIASKPPTPTKVIFYISKSRIFTAVIHL